MTRPRNIWETTLAQSPARWDRWAAVCLAVWRRQRRRHPDRFTTGPDGPHTICHDPLYLAVSAEHIRQVETR